MRAYRFYVAIVCGPSGWSVALTSMTSKVEKHGIASVDSIVIYEMVLESLDNGLTSGISICKHANVIRRNLVTVDKILPNRKCICNTTTEIRYMVGYVLISHIEGILMAGMSVKGRNDALGQFLQGVQIAYVQSCVELPGRI